MKLIILGTPKAKQSARFRAITSKKTGKTFVSSYQKTSVVENASNIGKAVLSQLPLGFVPFDYAIGAKVTFVFPVLSSWNKTTKQLFENGTTIYKTSKPDVDNCIKALFDGLNGILFIDDSRVSKVLCEKIYGKEPRTEIEIYKL